MRKLAFLVIALLVLSVSAFARNDLNARSQHLGCRSDLLKSQAQSLSTLVTAPSTDKLDSDMTQLSQLATSGNVKDFNSFVKNIVKPDFDSVRDNIKSAKAELKALNLTKAEKKKLLLDSRVAWKSAIDKFKQCNSQSKRTIADTRKNAIMQDIARWNSQIEKMKAKSIDTTGLESVVADANKLASMLDSAVQAADDAAFKQKVDEVRNSQLHVWARFHIAKIEAYLNNLEPSANEAGLSSKVSEIKALLSEAKQLALSGKKYGEGEFDKTWKDIKDAGELLKSLSKSLKGDAK